jgi:hypothetical protein
MMIVQFGNRPIIPARVANSDSKMLMSRGESRSVVDEPQAWSIGGKVAAAVIRFASDAKSQAANANEGH